MKIFITGGAGYIGSHVSLQLLNAGHEITIYDDLSLSSLKNIDKRAKFIKGSTLDISLLEKSLSDNINLVIHLAGYKAAGESMEIPSKYSNNNINDNKSEFLIPSVINDLINSGEQQVQVLYSKSSWFGVTYKEDKPYVVQQIQNLVNSGFYPHKLYPLK